MIHWLSPVLAAIVPSSAVAVFIVSQGRPRSTLLRKTGVDGTRCIGQQARAHVDASVFEACNAAARYPRVRIDDGGGNMGDAGADQGVGTRCGFTLVAAGLQRDIGVCAFGQRAGLGPTPRFRRAGGHRAGSSRARQRARRTGGSPRSGRTRNTADSRVRRDTPEATFSECQRGLHPGVVSRPEGRRCGAQTQSEAPSPICSTNSSKSLASRKFL